MTFLDRAAPLLERGFSLIPLKPASKEPIGPGATSKTRDAAIISEWSNRWPDANVAVCADENFCILDSDDAAALEAKIGRISTYTVQSSAGKAHLYFRKNGFDVRNLELGKLGSLRSVNYYVVGKGSIHPKTGEPYQVIKDVPVATLELGLYHELEHLALEADREIERITVNWDGVSKIPESMRHYFLMSQAGKLWDGKISEEELFAKLQALNEKFCDAPKPEGEVRRMVDWVMNKEPNVPAPALIIGGPKMRRKGYIMEPLTKWDRWFPLGQVGLIYGASGAGKSHLLLQMLESVAYGGEFLGHATPSRSLLLINLDRDDEAQGETLDKLRIPRHLFPTAALPEDAITDTRLAAKAVNELVEQNGRPEVVAIEGLDALCLDQTQRGIVPFIRSFQRIAAHHGTAVVGTWGSPKRMSSPRESYKGLRDAASGSGMVGRLCTTMVYVREDYDTGMRHVECGHRQCKHEVFEMRFVDDRLVPWLKLDDTKVDDPIDALIARGFTWSQVKDSVKCSESTFYRRQMELEQLQREMQEAEAATIERREQAKQDRAKAKERAKDCHVTVS